MMLREGATSQSAVEALGYALSRLASARSHGPGETMRDSFLRVHDEIESQLTKAFDRPAVQDVLQGARYWYIVGTPAANNNLALLRPVNLAVNQECEALESRLKAVQASFAALAAWLTRPGLPTLIDTNVLMHCQPIDQVDWRSELKGLGSAGDLRPRLIVPLAVVDELDRKKFEGAPSMRERASKAITSLRELRKGCSADEAARVKAAGGGEVTLEIPRDDIGRMRLQGTDDELIDFGAFLSRASGGRDVALVTRDFGAEIRADRRGLKVVWLDDRYRKDKDQ